jgi:hypothetical protein
MKCCGSVYVSMHHKSQISGQLFSCLPGWGSCTEFHTYLEFLPYLILLTGCVVSRYLRGIVGCSVFCSRQTSSLGVTSSTQVASLSHSPVLSSFYLSVLAFRFFRLLVPDRSIQTFRTLKLVAHLPISSCYCLTCATSLLSCGCRVLINLTYSKGANVRSRVERLRHLGLDTQLRKLVNDSCLDVQVRFQTLALSNGF